MLLASLPSSSKVRTCILQLVGGYFEFCAICNLLGAQSHSIWLARAVGLASIGIDKTCSSAASRHRSTLDFLMKKQIVLMVYR
jgi:hypothetical protein